MKLCRSALVAASLAGASLAGASRAGAVVLFSDNFSGYPTALTVTSLAPNWTVTGNVDVVASGTYGITCNGKCIDLDGTSGPGALTSKPIAFLAGKPVTLSFSLSGNQRGSADDAFYAAALFAPLNGGIANSISGPAGFVGGGFLNLLNNVPYTETIVAGRPFLTYSLSFVANIPGTFQLQLGTPSADNIGPLLDSVSVSQAVPEPATWVMLIAGFGLVGYASRRRRATVAA